MSHRLRRGIAVFRASRDVVRALDEGAPAELGTLYIEPLAFSASLRVSGGEAYFALAARAPNLAPYGVLRIEGEVGLVDQQKELWRTRAFSDSLAAPARAPEARLAAVSFGRRDDLLRHTYWKADGHVVFGMLLSQARLLPAPGRLAPPAYDRPLFDPGFVVRRLQDENTALRLKLRQLGATLDTVLEAACPAAEPAGGPGDVGPPADVAALAAALASAVCAAAARGDQAELRDLRRLLAELSASADKGLEDASAEPCCVCLERAPGTSFRPCGHACCCAACAAPLATCPLCRAAIASLEPLAPAPAPS